MFVGLHPDDIELRCGGLILELKEQSKEVVYVIAIDGAADKPLQTENNGMRQRIIDTSCKKPQGTGSADSALLF